MRLLRHSQVTVSAKRQYRHRRRFSPQRGQRIVVGSGAKISPHCGHRHNTLERDGAVDVPAGCCIPRTSLSRGAQRPRTLSVGRNDSICHCDPLPCYRRNGWASKTTDERPTAPAWSEDSILRYLAPFSAKSRFSPDGRMPSGSKTLLPSWNFDADKGKRKGS